LDVDWMMLFFGILYYEVYDFVDVIIGDDWEWMWIIELFGGF